MEGNDRIVIIVVRVDCTEETFVEEAHSGGLESLQLLDAHSELGDLAHVLLLLFAGNDLFLQCGQFLMNH